jgi:membrane protease YdiL (CAAX protease family)
MLSEKSWRIEAVLQFCAGLFACFFLGMAVSGVLQKIGLNGFKKSDDLGNILLATLSFQGAAWVLMFFFLRQHQLGWRDVFGFRGEKAKRDVALAVGVVIVILPVALGLEFASAFILQKLGHAPEDQTAVQLIAGAKSWWTRVYLGFFAVVLAPVAEEFIFRGMLFPFVRQLGYPRLAWFGVSALFALIHADAAIFVPLFVFALALTWLYEKTDNLLAPIVAHGLFNAANLVVLSIAQNVPPPK